MPLINFLHTFHPSPILLSLGSVHIYWYGFFIVAGILSALTVAARLGKCHGVKTETIIDLIFWLIVGGIIGARLYDVLLEWQYFSMRPLDILKIWRGGLAIHGAIIGGLTALWLFTKKYRHDFWPLAAIMATVLPLAQAIGRWGNYFNQELFGKPTNLPWGIPIDQLNRPRQYLGASYFHPAFLYESLGNLIIFAVLIVLFINLAKKKSAYPEFQISNFKFQISIYFLLYSLLRFFLEFIRLDSAPVMLGLRFPQLISLIFIVGCLVILRLKFPKKLV